MNSAEILALMPGAVLDAAVHKFVMGGAGDAPGYSTDDAQGLKILDRLPLFVGRVDSSHTKFDPNRQFVAGALAYAADRNGDVSTLRVTAPTKLAALCKAALLTVFRSAKSDRPMAAAARPAPAQTSAEAARAVAARIGTPGARNPAAGVRAAQEAADRRNAARLLKEQKEAKKRNRERVRAGLAPEPLPTAESIKPARGRRAAASDEASATMEQGAEPVRQRVAQPTVFTRHKPSREPMPTRVKEFKPPQPIQTAGRDQKL